MGRALPYAQLSSILLIFLAVLARSDIANAQQECSGNVMQLMSCIPYVQGMTPSPNTMCCNGLNKVISTSKRCLCLLIDRNSNSNSNNQVFGPDINASQAENLAIACNSIFNETECIGLLQLAPTSPDARMFQTVVTSSASSSASVRNGNVTVSANSSSSARAGTLPAPTGPTNTTTGEAWSARGMSIGLLISCFGSLFLIHA